MNAIELTILNRLNQFATQDEITFTVFHESQFVSMSITRADFEAIADGNTLDEILSCEADMEWVAIRLAHVAITPCSPEYDDAPAPSLTDIEKMAEQMKKAMTNTFKKYANEDYIYLSKDFNITMAMPSPTKNLWSLLKKDYMYQLAEKLGFESDFNQLSKHRLMAMLLCLIYPNRYGFTKLWNPRKF